MGEALKHKVKGGGDLAANAKPRTLRAWVKSRNSPAARAIYAAGMAARRLQIPYVAAIHRPLYQLDRGVRQLFGNMLRIVWYTPLFQSRLVRPAKDLRVLGSIPLVLGDLQIEIGSNCLIYGRTLFTGRSVGGAIPTLTLGDNVEIGYQSKISVGRRIEIGNNVLIAPDCSISGYPGHPLDPVARANHMPDLDEQVGDIIIEDDVWLANGVRVMSGVRIGRATVVAAGSIVSRDLPPNVIAAGVPARPVRSLLPADKDPSAAPATAPPGPLGGQ